MTTLQTTEAERKRIKNWARADRSPVIASIILRFLADFYTLQEQLAQADAELDWIARHDHQDMEFGPAMAEARARHQSRQQMAKGNGQ